MFSTPKRRYPQVYQHNLLINKDLRRWIISRLGDGCCGLSHTDDYRVGGVFPGGRAPLTLRMMPFSAFVLVESTVGTLIESVLGKGEAATSEAEGGGAISSAPSTTAGAVPPKLGTCERCGWSSGSI